MRPALFALALFAAAPAVAQMAAPGSADPKRVAAGSYMVESNHTQIQFGVSHLGFNPYFGTFSGASGTLVLDPAQPSATQLSVSVPVASIQTTSDKLTAELKTPEWLDAAKYPTMTFKSRSVSVRGTSATILGDLSFHGVTKPMTLQATFTGAGPSPMGGKQTVGFTGTGSFKRSDFGAGKYAPMVGDEVMLSITAAFEKTGDAASAKKP